MFKYLKGNKNARHLGLFILFVVVIIAIVLTVFLTNKFSIDSAQTVAINELYVTESANFKVTNITFEDLDHQSNFDFDDNLCYAVVSIEVEAKSTITVRWWNFKLNNSNPKQNDFNSSTKIATGEGQTLVLKFAVEKDSSVPLVIVFYGCKVQLGSTLISN